jgi:hypothetical protein
MQVVIYQIGSSVIDACNCKVEIVDIDGSIDYWHQEGARGR